MIKAILVDYGGVLTNNSSWDPVVINYCKLKNIDQANVISKAIKIWDKVRLGKANSKEFWKVISDYTKIPSKKVKQDILNHFGLNHDFIKILRDLSKYYLLIMASNQIEDWLETVIKKVELNSLFYKNLSSYKIGVAKPNQSFYQTIQEQIGFSYQEFLFIDDSKKNLDVAKILGINTILYINNQRLLKNLKLYGIKISTETKYESGKRS